MKWGLFAFILLLTPLTTRTAAAASADDAFKAVYTAEWKWREQQFPGLGRDEDDDIDDTALPDDHLESVDAKTQSARLAYWSAVLEKLEAIAPNDLSPEQRIDYEVYKPQIENLAASVRFRAYEMPFNSDSQFWSDLGFMSERHLKNEKQARDYIAKLNDFPRYFDENIVNMRAGLKRGFSVPREVLAGRDVSISTFVDAKAPQDSDFYKPFKKLP